LATFDTSLLLARVWGIFIIIVCLGFFANRTLYKNIIEDFKKPGLLYLSGFFTLIIGLLSVLYYNIWTADWRVIITLLGWIACLKGSIRILFPEFVIRMISRVEHRKMFYVISFALSCMVGLYLFLIGFGFIE